MRVLIVDNHHMITDGLRSALDGLVDIEAVGEAANGEDAVLAAKDLTPDLVFMDDQMHEMDRLAAVKVILADHPDTKIIMFAVSVDSRSVAKSLKKGVSGYLPKDVTGAELLATARIVMEGKFVIHPAFLPQLIPIGCP